MHKSQGYNTFFMGKFEVKNSSTASFKARKVFIFSSVYLILMNR